MEIIWTKDAVDRVEEISNFIGGDSRIAAFRFINRLIGSVERLSKHPLSGPICRENMAFRQLVYKKYRIIYRIMGKRIHIVTVVSPGLSVASRLAF